MEDWLSQAHNECTRLHLSVSIVSLSLPLPPNELLLQLLYIHYLTLWLFVYYSKPSQNDGLLLCAVISLLNFLLKSNQISCLGLFYVFRNVSFYCPLMDSIIFLAHLAFSASGMTASASYLYRRMEEYWSAYLSGYLKWLSFFH